EPTATLPSDSGITSSGDSSSAIGPWSLAFLVIIVWLRRHLKSQFLVELATSGNRAGETC
ncbi:MAG: GlyGly-CTERM sorting domain-containing protein, partial [Gammaproteobacteria bacterium]|nr:GlyGly-CTERM sorting domain-containing protein [Gammaproteobacteria bacterium]